MSNKQKCNQPNIAPKSQMNKAIPSPHNNNSNSTWPHPTAPTIAPCAAPSPLFPSSLPTKPMTAPMAATIKMMINQVGLTLIVLK